MPESFKSFNNCYDNDNKVETQSNHSVEAGGCRPQSTQQNHRKMSVRDFFFFFSELVRQRVSFVPLVMTHYLHLLGNSSSSMLLFGISFSFFNLIHCLDEFPCNTNMKKCSDKSEFTLKTPNLSLISSFYFEELSFSTIYCIKFCKAMFKNYVMSLVNSLSSAL